MYLEHFGLKEYPFSTSPDPRFYYPSAKHKEALACLIYTVEQSKGFALISGEVGAGKTMLCRAALQRLGKDVDSAIVCHTSITPTQFLKAIAAEFHLSPWSKTKIEIIHMLRTFLVKRQRQGRTVVLIVDEAQALSAEVLEEVRLLGNLETTTEKLMQTILVGQPELRRLVGQHRLRQLDQRIAVKFHLGALSLDGCSTPSATRHCSRRSSTRRPSSPGAWSATWWPSARATTWTGRRWSLARSQGAAPATNPRGRACAAPSAACTSSYTQGTPARPAAAPAVMRC